MRPGLLQDETSRPNDTRREREKKVLKQPQQQRAHGFLAFDRALTITSCDSGAETLTGRDGITGRPLRDLYVNEEEWHLAVSCALGTLEGKRWEGDWEHHRRDGGRALLAASWAPVCDASGRATGGAFSMHGEVEPAGDDRRGGWASYLVDEVGLSRLTAYTYEANVQRFERWSGTSAAEATVESVRAFMGKSHFNPATKTGTLNGLKSLVKFMLLEGKIDPARGQGILVVRPPRNPRNPLPALSGEQARTLVDACKRTTEHRLIFLGLYAGMRISESARLKPDEWLPDRLRFTGKGNKLRDIPLHPILQGFRAEILSKSPVSRETLKATARSLSHYTGIKFTSHALRRTFSCRLDELNVQESTIQALMGHAMSSVLRTNYAPVRWDKMVEAIQLLGYDEGGMIGAA